MSPEAVLGHSVKEILRRRTNFLHIEEHPPGPQSAEYGLWAVPQLARHPPAFYLRRLWSCLAGARWRSGHRRGRPASKRRPDEGAIFVDGVAAEV